MTKKYTSEQFWKLYEKLPQELKDVLFAEETGNNIFEICKRNKVEEDLEAIVDYVGQVLVGVLPPEEFSEILEKDLGLKKEVVKKVAQEINRFVFYPVKPSLEQLYKMEITPSEKIEGKPSFAKTTEDKEEKPTKPAEEDVYRELIE